MSIFLKLRARATSLRIFEYITMSKSNEKIYYAVGRGREIGIYDTWKECKIRTEGVPNAKYRKFFSLEEAEEFVNFWKNYSSPVKESDESQDSVEFKIEVDKLNEESKNFGEPQPAKEEPNSKQDDSALVHQEQSAPAVPHFHSSPLLSTSFDGATESRNTNVLALNLRLDSFERRFDTFLKEIGAIASEISHIRSDIKELKETLSSALSSNPACGSGYSPKKGRDGMLQTTLAFGSANKSPAKSYSTYKDGTNSEESSLRRGKGLKRKLSRSNSSESPKRFADGEADHEDLLKKMKPETVDHSYFSRDEDDFVEVYTDGASHGNGKDDAKAGIGIWWGDDHPLNVAEPVAGPPTNNTAEIQAARVAMELAAKCGLKKLKILTDSEFLINCATRWIHRWKKNGWLLVNGGPVKNRKELEKLDKAAGKISVRWEKVAAHVGIRGNEMADRLANEGAYKSKR